MVVHHGRYDQERRFEAMRRYRSMHFKAVESRCKWRLALVGMASIWLVIASMVCAGKAQEENTIHRVHL